MQTSVKILPHSKSNELFEPGSTALTIFVVSLSVGSNAVYYLETGHSRILSSLYLFTIRIIFLTNATLYKLYS